MNAQHGSILYPRNLADAHVHDGPPACTDGRHVFLQLAAVLGPVLRRRRDIGFPIQDDRGHRAFIGRRICAACEQLPFARRPDGEPRH